MQVKIQKWENSLAVQIPKTFALETQLKSDSFVNMWLSNGKIIIEPNLMTEPLTLDELLSAASYNNRVGLMLLCPITNKVKGYPFEVNIPTGLKVTGVILADQIKSLDWRVRNAALICRLPTTTVTEVLKKLNTLLS